MQRLRIGVVGAGVIAQVMHLHYLRELSDRYDVVALCDISSDSADKNAAVYGIPQTYTSWQDMISNAGLDAILILTNGSHAPIAIAAANAGIHVLTLTATPIPRTLEMSLVGIRDLSVLHTPPADRQPILTYVGEYDERAVAEAIRRELLREGQVFYVPNRVMDIEQHADRHQHDDQRAGDDGGAEPLFALLADKRLLERLGRR